MKYEKIHISGSMPTAAGLILLPLFAFLLFSCPVKRALLSSFISVNPIELADRDQAQSVLTAFESGQLHCCHNKTVAKKTTLLQAANNSVYTSPVDLIPAFILFRQNVFRKTVLTSFLSRQRPARHVHLFLDNQSLLI